MISPVNNSHAPEVDQQPKPAPRPAPQPQTPRSGELSSDQVTLKSAGQIDHDADQS